MVVARRMICSRKNSRGPSPGVTPPKTAGGGGGGGGLTTGGGGVEPPLGGGLPLPTVTCCVNGATTFGVAAWSVSVGPLNVTLYVSVESSGLSTVTVSVLSPGVTLAPLTGSLPPAVPVTVKSELETEPPSGSSNEIVIVVPPSEAVAARKPGGVVSGAAGGVNVTTVELSGTPSTVVVNVTGSAVRSVAVNVAWPLPSVVVCAETTALPPVTVTSLPGIATL